MYGDFFRGRSIHESMQLHTDGALARYYSPRDFRSMAQKAGFAFARVETAGPKSDVIFLPGGGIKRFFSRIMPNALNRFFVRTCRMGSFLIISLTK